MKNTSTNLHSIRLIPENKVLKMPHNTDNKINRFVTVFALAPTPMTDL